MTNKGRRRKRKTLRFLDLFAGIGGFRLGLEQAGHKCIGFCEIDKFARKSYKVIHDTEGEVEFHDITQVSNEQWASLKGSVDIICGGFPCQAFSIAGRRKGFLDETRGTLFFEIARAAEQIKPRTLFLENVRGILSHDAGNTFRIILSTLDELGYNVEWQLLNSKNFGVPQNRDRVFIIGHLRGERRREVFPIIRENSGAIKVINKENGMPRETNRVYSLDGVSPTLNTMQGGGREPKIQVGARVRKLTPRECWRLQGFPDWAFDKAQEVNSNSQLYKQAGNSVTVHVIHEIARRLR